MKEKNKFIIVFYIIVGVISGYMLFVFHSESSFVENKLVAGDFQDIMLSFSKKRSEESMSQTAINPLFISGQKLFDSFDGDTRIEETALLVDENHGLYWWLNSGAYLYISNGVAKTVQGNLELDSKWQIKYKNYNASETDNGFHPQNIFRLVTKSKWKNFTQECYYKVNKYILSADSHRSASNGLLLFNRYQDGDNLYYTGVRVDGTAIIKKKIRGEYYTMSQEPLYSGKYDQKKNPNLLPVNTWVGIRSEVNDTAEGTVSIKVFVDKDRSGNWVLVATAEDDGKQYGGAIISQEGYAGIRTDFMDVEFDDYQIEEKR